MGVESEPAEGVAEPGEHDVAVGHDRAAIWLRRVGRRVATGRAFGTRVGTGLALSWPPLVLTIALYLLTGPWDVGFAVAHLLTTLLLVLAPPFVAYYDGTALTEFFEDTRGHLITDDVGREQLDSFVERTNRRFAERHHTNTALWGILLAGVYVASPGFATAQGIDGVWDPAWWVYLSFYVWGGLTVAPGFHGIYTTMVSIHELMADDDITLSVDPLHRDGLGGLSTVGRLAIRTTMLASIGALALPLAFEMAFDGGFTPFVYALVVVYTAFILASFVYPTWIVHRKADELRKDELDERKRAIEELRRRAGTTNDPTDASTDDVALRLEIQRIREEYQDYRDVRLYPVSVDILSKLAGSVLLPVFFLLLELGVKWALIW